MPALDTKASCLSSARATSCRALFWGWLIALSPHPDLGSFYSSSSIHNSKFFSASCLLTNGRCRHEDRARVRRAQSSPGSAGSPHAGEGGRPRFDRLTARGEGDSPLSRQGIMQHDRTHAENCRWHRHAGRGRSPWSNQLYSYTSAVLICVKKVSNR